MSEEIINHDSNNKLPFHGDNKDVAVVENDEEGGEIVKEESSVLVTNLTRKINKGHIQEIFSYYGKVNDVKMKFEKSKEGSKHSAIITFSNEEEAEQAVYHMHEGTMDGNKINVGFILVKKNQGWYDIIIIEFN
jgi:RNA recognition motif-containing protein